MKSELPKQSSDEKGTGSRSINKYVAIATMAASLGVSLGVAVVDAVAAEGYGSPPENRLPPSSKSQKIQGQSNQIKMGSHQYKESNQLKGSNQLKYNQNVGTTGMQGSGK